MTKNKTWYLKGLRDGIPVALGYFAVSFALGVIAKKVGLTAFQAGITALLTNASAGAYSGFALMAAGAGVLETAISQFIVNARYLLMSCAISQKLSPKTGTGHRLIMSVAITDEIFGLTTAVKDNLNPFYNYGIMSISMPCWCAGTALGVIMGNILPERLVSALGVGLFGMFLAIIIPPARKSKVIAGVIAASMALSAAFTYLPFLSGLSEGMRVILLTVIISLAAAIAFPIEEADGEGEK